MIYCYHHNDMDGLFAGAIVDRAFPVMEKKFISTSYPIDTDNVINTLSAVVGITKVFFVDLSFGYNKKRSDVPFIERLASICKEKSIELVWIDHHEKSKILVDTVKLPENMKYRVDTSECGALGTYHYLHGEDSKCPPFLSLVDIWDRHLTDARGWENAIYFQYKIMLDMKTPSDLCYTELLTGGAPYLTYICQQGKLIYDYFSDHSKKLIASDAVITKVNGIECLALNVHDSSMIFDSVRNKFPLLMQWHYDGSLYHYSIYRGNENIDCNAIAMEYGGGGHVGAAGFSSSVLLFQENMIKYKPK